MNADRNDIFEALLEAPGEQILELGAEIDTLLKSIELRDDVSPALGQMLDRQLRYLAARARHIEPIVEKLQTAVENLDLRPEAEDEDLSETTSFLQQQQPAFAAVLLGRLASAREADDQAAAAGMRDIIATYARTSPIELVRDALIDGMRADALVHGETTPGYAIPPLDELRQHLFAVA